MHAQVKSISSFSDFDTYLPLDANVFGVEIYLHVGTPDSEGGDRELRSLLRKLLGHPTQVG